VKSKIPKPEIRRFNVETRAEGEGEEPTKIVGYAAVFNSIEYGEMIAPGAFSKSLSEQKDIKAYLGHDSNIILARSENGTLKLSEDEHGLAVEIYPNLKAQSDRDILAKVERGDINQMSFGFSPVKDETMQLDGQTIRVLKEVKLHEVSIVTEPWYSATTAEARDRASDEQPEPVLADHSTDDPTFSRVALLRLKQTQVETEGELAWM
jgi:HK97 family phage prohead protease